MSGKADATWKYPTLREVVTAILIACRNLIDSLRQQFEQGVVSMSRRPWVINLGCSTTENVEPLIDFPHQKKTGVAGDLCALKINADGAVKFRPDHSE
ncbi:MAG: hypothetical protein WB930_08075 [Syntrophobacteraceae bacterium]